MTITDIRIRKIIPEGRLRGVISITIDGQFAVHDIKVVQGDERMFVAMPSRKDDSGVFRDIVHPITPEARQMIESEILSAFLAEIEAREAEAVESESEADKVEEV
ncbi:MAG: SpoVG family protein [Oscillospiraceae bacterium]|jgi:stage V sporulation protein G